MPGISLSAAFRRRSDRRKPAQKRKGIQSARPERVAMRRGPIPMVSIAVPARHPVAEITRVIVPNSTENTRPRNLLSTSRWMSVPDITQFAPLEIAAAK